MATTIQPKQVRGPLLRRDPPVEKLYRLYRGGGGDPWLTERDEKLDLEGRANTLCFWAERSSWQMDFFPTSF